MSNARLAGLSLIGGTAATVVTMAFHPTGHDLVRDFASAAPLNRAVHALAIAGALLGMYGIVGLFTVLREQQQLATAALVGWAAATVAVMFAAMASGFIAPELVARMLAGGDAAREAYAPLQAYNHAFNQACARVYAVLASVSIGLWSVAMLRSATLFGRALPVVGIVGGSAAALATLGGLRLDVHGFGAVVLVHGIWLVWTGVRMYRT